MAEEHDRQLAAFMASHASLEETGEDVEEWEEEFDEAKHLAEREDLLRDFMAVGDLEEALDYWKSLNAEQFEDLKAVVNSGESTKEAFMEYRKKYPQNKKFAADNL